MAGKLQCWERDGCSKFGMAGLENGCKTLGTDISLFWMVKMLTVKQNPMKLTVQQNDKKLTIAPLLGICWLTVR